MNEACFLFGKLGMEVDDMGMKEAETEDIGQFSGPGVEKQQVRTQPTWRQERGLNANPPLKWIQ